MKVFARRETVWNNEAGRVRPVLFAGVAEAVRLLSGSEVEERNQNGVSPRARNERGR